MHCQKGDERVMKIGKACQFFTLDQRPCTVTRKLAEFRLFSSNLRLELMSDWL